MERESGGPTKPGTKTGGAAGRKRRGKCAPGLDRTRAHARAIERAAQAHLLARLVGDAERIAARFALRYASIDAERASVTRRYGVCFQDGRIRIRLRHASTGRPLKYSSLVNTLCHELAHLRHFNHGPRFKAFYLRLLEWARSEGIYRPGQEPADSISIHAVAPIEPSSAPANAIARAPDQTRSRAAPVQLPLFV